MPNDLMLICFQVIEMALYGLLLIISIIHVLGSPTADYKHFLDLDGRMILDR